MASQRISGILSRNQPGSDGRASLGVFGKHPGWNDHIEDIGLTTERLVQIKRVLYVEGIGGNIDAGAWDAMPESGRLPGFEHLFLWRWSGDLAIGRFWSSRDGKGRTRYPMVATAQVHSQPASWQVRYVAPMLERLEEEFKSADSSERVIALAENAQKEMEALAAGEPAPPDKFDQSATATLAAHPAMGPDRRGMHRLLYQMERELSAFMRGGVTDGSRTRVADLTPRHLRVPRCLADEAQSVLLWWRFVVENIGDSAPIVMLSPRGAEFIDILIGESGVSQFTCVRAGEATIPLTTEIPYTFDAEFIKRAEARIAGAPAEVKSETVKKSAPVSTAVAGALEKVKAAGGSRGLEPKTIAMIAGIGVLGLVLIGGLLLLMSGGGGKGAGGTTGGGSNGGGTPSGGGAPRQGDSPSATGAPASAAFGPQQRADFAEWCASAEWALQLRDRLASRDLSSLTSDPHLNQALIPLLDRLRNSDLILDPRRVATGGPRQLAALGAQPPASAQTEEAIARTRDALVVIRGIKAAVTTDAWPARAAVARTAQMARLAGWTNLSATLDAVAGGVNIEANSGISSVEGVARTAPGAARLEAAWARYEAAHRDLIEAQGDQRDQRLATLPALLARVELPATVAPESASEGVTAAAGRLEGVAALTQELARVTRERWPVLEVGYFLSASPLDVPAGGADEAYFRAWMQEVRRDAYSRLDPAGDPRRTWEVPARVDALAQQIAGLKQAGGQVDAGQIQALEQELASLRQRVAATGGLEWNRAGEREVIAATADLDRAIGALEGGYDRLTGQLTQQWERETTRLRERASAGGVTSPALQAAWRERRDDLLGEFTTPDRLSALTERVEELEAFLGSIEGSAPMPAMPRERPSVLDADALERAMQAERQRVIVALLGQASWDGQRYDAPALAPAMQEARQSLVRWGERVTDASASMATVEDLLAGGYGVEEGGAGGATIKSLVAAARPEAVGAGVAGVFEPLLQRVREVEQAGTIRDQAALAALAGGAETSLSAALTAWRALSPASVDDLRAQVALARLLSARASGIADAGRRDAVTREIQAALPQRWAKAAAQVQAGPDQGAMRQVMALRREMGVTDDSLAPALRFNALCDEFGTLAQAAGAGADEAALKRAASELVAKVEALGLGGDALAPVAPWLDEVRALASDAPSAPVIDVTTLGPGSVGWRGEELENGQRVRFTSPDGSLALEFVRVEPGDDPGVSAPAYLGTTEVPIAVLQWAAAQGDHLGRLKSLTEMSPPGDAAGYKTWVFGTRQGREGVVPAENWFLAGEVAQGIQPWGQGLTPGRPGAKTPVTQIAPATASALAEWLGCRLPSSGEWLGGRARYETGNGGTPPAWNLRDNTWGAQLRHVREVQGSGRLGIKYPDEGVFHPDGSSAKTDRNAQTIGTEDGSLLFDEVDRARGRVLLHLVGNVSEYVVMGDMGGTPQFGVVGASALSAPEDYQALQAACAVPVESVEYGWSDVGVRLAFGATGEGGAVPLWRRMQRVGSAAPVLVGVSPR